LTLFVLPGMGATSMMYRGAWRSLEQTRFLDWPDFAGEDSLRGVAERVAAETAVGPDDWVAGSSLGGMVALELAATVGARAAVLIGSAVSSEEVRPLLRSLAPLSSLTPIRLAQVLAGKSSGDVGRMFSTADPSFIRSMCRALVQWEGPSIETVVRIHGSRDRVIPCPASDAHVVEGAGHLVAVTHPEECVRALSAELTMRH